jgi:pimeloyl-ACP methyl ester carboxylesterase
MSAREAHAVREIPYFFGPPGEQIFAMLHVPANGVASTGIVLCHALGEEKLWSHRVYVTFARAAAAKGYAVLRFDTRGEGDSDREFEATDVATRVADCRAAIDQLRERVPSLRAIFLLGHRIGGSIAWTAAAEARRDIAGVVVWDPIADGRDYLGQLLRSHLATQMATRGKISRNRDELVRELQSGSVVVDGYGISAGLYAQLAQLRWAESGEPTEWLRGALLIEVGRPDQSEPSPKIAALVRPGVSVRLAQEPPFWRETRQFHQRAPQFSGLTFDWLTTP